MIDLDYGEKFKDLLTNKWQHVKPEIFGGGKHHNNF